MSEKIVEVGCIGKIDDGRGEGSDSFSRTVYFSNTKTSEVRPTQVGLGAVLT